MPRVASVVAKRAESGSVAIMVAVMLVMLIGFAALVVDIGYLYATRGELQNASDSAAHAAAQFVDGTSGGLTNAQNAAKNWAQMHLAANSDVEILDDDIVFGYWHIVGNNFCSPVPCFQPLGPLSSSPDPAAVNAVQVTSRRTNATGDELRFSFAGLIGNPEADVTAVAQAVGGGPSVECGFPLVVSDCAIQPGLEDCEYCMIFQDDGTDNAGWTTFSPSGHVGGPAIAGLIREGCFDESGETPSVDPVTHECNGECNLVPAGAEIQVQNGNLMNEGNNNFCPLIRDILLRDGEPAKSFVVRVPVIPCGDDGTADFKSTQPIVGFATMEIFGVRCVNSGDEYRVPGALPCQPPPSNKYVIATLRCDLASTQPAGAGNGGTDAPHIRLVQ